MEQVFLCPVNIAKEYSTLNQDQKQLLCL